MRQVHKYKFAVLGVSAISAALSLLAVRQISRLAIACTGRSWVVVLLGLVGAMAFAWAMASALLPLVLRLLRPKR